VFISQISFICVLLNQCTITKKYYAQRGTYIFEKEGELFV
jgi:hypothetical protein